MTSTRAPAYKPVCQTVPELYCTDFERSLIFHTQFCGFAVRYVRPEERFAYLDLDGVELMLEQTLRPERTFVAAVLEYAFARA